MEVMWKELVVTDFEVVWGHFVETLTLAGYFVADLDFNRHRRRSGEDLNPGTASCSVA
jgi:hypothetical protein